MIDPILYNVPVAMVEAYGDRQLIVRAQEPSAIVGQAAIAKLEHLAYVQILGLGAEMDCLLHWPCPAPLDLVVQSPETELPLLYRYAPILADRPVRVTVPLVPGFSKLVRLAVALDFAVRIEGSQPSPFLIDEMQRVVDEYLHRTTVTAPIEFFHSIFLAFYHQDCVSLWTIQEEDPSQVRYLTDQGEETLSKRFAPMDAPSDLSTFVSRFRARLIAERRECHDCEFLACCSSYFKWPAADYDCVGIKSLLHRLKEAAGELRKDLSAYLGSGGRELPG